MGRTKDLIGADAQNNSSRAGILEALRGPRRDLFEPAVFSIILFSSGVVWGQVAPAASPSADAARLDPRWEELDQRQRIFERKIEIDQEKAAERAKEIPVTALGANGLSIKSADGAFVFRPRALVQADYRFYLADDTLRFPNTFLVRRVRPILDFTLFNWIDLRVTPDFGDGKVVLYDAYVDLRFTPALKLRAGKFKPPVGLERLQSASNLVFIERGHPTSLVPNRDLGVAVHGEIGKGVFQYALGAFNGVPDGTLGDNDNNDSKDFIGRVFVHPLKPLRIDALSNWGLGFAASFGKQKGTAAQPNLPNFKTPGQQTFFSYLFDSNRSEATVVARSDRFRIAPQTYYYVGPFGLLAEYVYSKQRLAKGDEIAEISAQAFQVAASWVLTGEKASYESVQPEHPFSIENGTWGALELAARYHELGLDSAAFPTFADPSKSARLARSFGFGVNWHLGKGCRLAVNFERTDFKAGAATGDREPEHALFTRAQAAF